MAIFNSFLYVYQRVAVINHRKLALDRRSDLSEVSQLRPRGGGCGQGGTRVGSPGYGHG